MTTFIHCKNGDCRKLIAQDQARRGWCGACYTRWREAGRPDSGPPPARVYAFPPRARAKARAKAARTRAVHLAERTGGRLEAVSRLTGSGLSAQQISWELGVSSRTVTRYRAVLRKGSPVNDPVTTPIAPMPDPVSEDTLVRVAITIACNFAGNGGSPADALEIGDALGVTREHFAAAARLVGSGRYDYATAGPEPDQARGLLGLDLGY